MFKTTFAALVLLALLTACAANQAGQALEQLRVAPVAGDAYQNALAAGYREYAGEKAAAYDSVSARYFAEKGLLATQGRDVKPEYPSQLALSVEAFDDLVSARDKLLPALTASRSTQPEMAASAVVAYDRWVMLEEQKTDLPAIEDAREAFLAILTKLSEAHTATVADAPTTTIPTPAATAEKIKSGVLYFPLDSDTLGDSAQSAIAELVRVVQSNPKSAININGHADRLGTEDYNMDLSQRRARFVVDTLRKAGVAASMLKYFAYGESDPAVPTEDEVGEPKNRRVEIFIE